MAVERANRNPPLAVNTRLTLLERRVARIEARQERIESALTGISKAVRWGWRLAASVPTTAYLVVETWKVLHGGSL